MCLHKIAQLDLSFRRASLLHNQNMRLGFLGRSRHASTTKQERPTESVTEIRPFADKDAALSQRQRAVRSKLARPSPTKKSVRPQRPHLEISCSMMRLRVM